MSDLKAATARVALGGGTIVGAGRGVSRETAIDVVDAAYSAGIRFFDTAAMYSGGESEALLGEVLSPVRSDITLLTKGGVSYPDLSDLRTSVRDSSYDGLRRSLEGSLQRLRTDAVDVFLIHQYDESRSPEAAMESLQRLVDDGLTKAVGFSNFGKEECGRALSTGIPTYVEYSFSLLDRRYLDELAAAGRQRCRRITYGTFVHGLLAEPLTLDSTFAESDWRHRARVYGETGNSGSIFYSGDAYGDNVLLAGRLRAIAAGIGVSLAALALAVTRDEPFTDLILIGCRSVAELRDDLSALALALDTDTLAVVDEALRSVERPSVNALGSSARPTRPTSTQPSSRA